MPVVTIWGTPRWANGGRSPNWAPVQVEVRRLRAPGRQRYPFVELAHLERAEPAPLAAADLAAVYTQTLLNPAYAAIHGATPGAKVAAA